MGATVLDRAARRGGVERMDREVAGGVVLVARRDPHLRDALLGVLRDRGHEVLSTSDGQSVLDTLEARPIDAVILDVDLPRVSGLSVLSAAPALLTDARFIVLGAPSSVQTAVEAMRLGAYDYLEEAAGGEEVVRVTERALAEGVVHGDTERVPRPFLRRGLVPIVGQTPVMKRVFRLVDRVAPTRATVLVTGETGTGKELVARAVHWSSPRADEPFVAVNCSAIPDTLMEAELFGHTRGSFTGAVQSRKGLIEEAAGGTLFLDEISTLSHGVQVKLLRVLEDRRVQRVGSNAPVSVDFRLIVATNTDLRPLVEAGDFREDLFFRLDVFPITVPPLRERRDDIALLADHFRSRFAAEHGIDPPRISTTILSRMMAYDWPGNVRELENFIERSVIMYPGRESFPFDLPRRAGTNGAAGLLERAEEEDWTLDRLEREYLLSTLERSRWRQGTAADILGINRRTIHRKLKRYREEGLLPEERV